MSDAHDFDAFVAARHRALVRMAFLLVGDSGHAEDLVQTALYRTYRHWGRLRSKDAADSYARTTITRLAARMSRRGWRRETATADVVLPDGPDPALARNVALDMHAALGRLPWAQRAVIVLRYFEDLSEADTAALLKCSPGTVKSRTSRALQSLRSDLGHALELDEQESRHG